MLRRIYVPTRGEVVGDWRRLNNKELCNLYTSINIIRVVKIKGKEKWGACGTHWRDANKILVGEPAGRDYLDDLSVDGRIILERILEKHSERSGLDSSGSRNVPVVNSCELGNESSCSM
jgi:hypothetical protein